jgi:hypothetical protein
MIGTLNQTAGKTTLYDTVARIMRTVRDAQ